MDDRSFRLGDHGRYPAWLLMRFSIRIFIFACTGLALFVVAIYYAFWFIVAIAEGFDGTSEFVELNGRQAKRRMAEWPSNVDPSEVKTASFKTEWARDSYSSWYRITLSPKAAKKWRDEFHDQKEMGPQEYIGHLHEGYEGIHRTILGPPPQHWQTGDTPKWWDPPSIDFRSTEVMVWYDNFDSGVGQAVYSAFNPENGELWIYDYAAQHDELWQNGKMPSGDAFGKPPP